MPNWKVVSTCGLHDSFLVNGEFHGLNKMRGCSKAYIRMKMIFCIILTIHPAATEGSSLRQDSDGLHIYGDKKELRF